MDNDNEHADYEAPDNISSHGESPIAGLLCLIGFSAFVWYLAGYMLPGVSEVVDQINSYVMR